MNQIVFKRKISYNINGDVMKTGIKLFNDIIYTLSGTIPKIGIDKTLSNHDLQLLKLTYDIICQYEGFKNAYICYKIGLKQDLLMKFFKECCYEDMRIFNKTFLLWKQLVFSIDDINNNLNLDHFIPFINKNLNINGIDYSNFKIDEQDQNWISYKTALIDDYHQRLNENFSKKTF